MRLIVRFALAACLAIAGSFAVPFELTVSFPVHLTGPAVLTGHSSDAPVKPRLSVHRGAQKDVRRALRPVPLTAANTVLAYPGPPIRARAAILVDVATGKVLYAKSPDDRLPIASTTKITTAAVVLHHAHLWDLVRASHNAASVGESTMELREGEVLSVRDLLYGMLLNSGNDAAVALAEYSGGTEAHFVDMMNALARRLHMRNTHYVTPHGLDAPGHYSSARDLATVARYAMRSPAFRQIVSTEYYHIPKTKHNVEHWLGNVNKVMYWYPGVDGVKPGDTDTAGLCQVVSARRNGRHVLAVLLNTPNLVTDIRNLLDMGTQDFQWVPTILSMDQPWSSITGHSGSVWWRYYFGAGHYISGPFLSYFDSHGGLQTLGYPRTEQIEENGRIVQYFQGGELVFDPAHNSVYPEPLGLELAQQVVPSAVPGTHRPASVFRDLYKTLGGRGVLGDPVTGLTQDWNVPVQFYDYGELALVGGSPTVVPVGDGALHRKRWLPAAGAADTFPPDMDGTFATRYDPPPPPPVQRRSFRWKGPSSSEIQASPDLGVRRIWRNQDG